MFYENKTCLPPVSEQPGKVFVVGVGYKLSYHYVFCPKLSKERVKCAVTDLEVVFSYF